MSTLSVVVTENYLAVVPATKTYKVAEKIATEVVGLGIAGGGLALGVAVAAEAYEKLFSNASKLDECSLAICFNSGHMVFARRQDVICHEIQMKEGMFSPTTYRVAVTGIFSHVRHEKIDFAFYFIGNEAIKALEGSGWEIRKASKKYTDISSAGQALAPRYLDSVQHHEQLVKWCAKCVHFRLRPSWITGKNKYGMLEGKLHSKTKPVDTELPCSIPTEVADVWNRYFALDPHARQKYATDCHRFKMRNQSQV